MTGHAVAALAMVGSLAAIACSPPVPTRVATACSAPLVVTAEGVYASCSVGVGAYGRDDRWRWTAGLSGVVEGLAVDGDEVFATDGDGVTVLDAQRGQVVRRVAGVGSLTHAVAVIGAHVYGVSSGPTATVLWRAPRAGGGPAEALRTGTAALTSLTATRDVLWLTETQAAGLTVLRLDDVNGTVTTVGEVPGYGSLGAPMVVESDRVIVAGLTGPVAARQVDALAVDVNSGAATVLATDIHGGVATGGGYWFFGQVRVDADGAAARFVPLAAAVQGAWVAADDADVYWNEDSTLWRLPVDSDPPAPHPGAAPHPPLVGLPP